MLPIIGIKNGRKMGIAFNAVNKSQSYVGRFVKENKEDMSELDQVKKIVSWFNNTSELKWRVEYRFATPNKDIIDAYIYKRK